MAITVIWKENEGENVSKPRSAVTTLNFPFCLQNIRYIRTWKPNFPFRIPKTEIETPKPLSPFRYDFDEPEPWQAF